MRSKALVLLAAGVLAGCGAPAVAPATKNSFDVDSPEGRAVMSKAHLQDGRGSSPPRGPGG